MAEARRPKFGAWHRRAASLVEGTVGVMWVRGTLSLILGAAACSGEAGQSHSDTVPISGRFVLFRYGGTPIPAPIAELPDHSQNPSGCWYSLTEGSLILTAETGLFNYVLTYRSSCDDRLLGTTAVAGRFHQVGPTLLFAIRGQTDSIRFNGAVHSDTVLIQWDSPGLYFRR
jgi:hypothetical protein